MSRICPHCGYARQSADAAPDWQCPSCEKAYSKAGGTLPPAGFRQYGAAASSERKGGLGKWLLIVFLLGGGFWGAQPMLRGKVANVASAQSVNQPEVHLYATDWCGYCKATREFFQANGIRYVEHDIEKSSEALNTHKKLGGNGVPLVVIGDDVIHGYNEGTMRTLLQPWIKG